jgi:hypothetical protein
LLETGEITARAIEWRWDIPVRDQESEPAGCLIARILAMITFPAQRRCSFALFSKAAYATTPWLWRP